MGRPPEVLGRRFRRRTFMSGLAISLVSGCTGRGGRSAPPFSPGPAVELESKVADTFSSREFHGTIVLAQDGHVRHQSVFGVANRDSDRPIESDDRYRFASITKPMVGVAAIRMRDAGTVGFDVDVREWVPDFPYEDVTLQHLLSHTSGLPSDEVIEKLWPEIDTIADTQQLYARLVAGPPRAGKPGRVWAYSNVGFDLAAHILSLASGRSIPDVLRHEVFEPAGMVTAATIVPGDNAQQGLETLGYVRKGDGWTDPRAVAGWEAAYWSSGVIGSCGAIGTAADLLAFADGIERDTLGVRAAFLEPATLRSGKAVDERSWTRFTYGRGVYISPHDGSYWHTGDWSGYLALFKVWPGRAGLPSRTAVVLQNHRNLDFGWYGDLEAIAAAESWS